MSYIDCKYLISKLERIAELNSDEFAYIIQIIPHHDGSLRYQFIAYETADKHNFVDEVGDSIESAMFKADISIKEACKLWDYKNVI